MKIALVAPSNILYMPYLKNYISILEEEGIEYSIINWDRLNIENNTSNRTFYDNKIGPRRGYLAYYRYSRFVRKELRRGNFDKVVIFGLQLSFFLRKLLLKEFKHKSIIDIRDHNKIVKYYDFKKLIKSAKHVVISSKAYKKWLPNDVEYILNHNTDVKKVSLGKFYNHDYNEDQGKENFNISFIGAIRDSNVNMKLINELRDSKKVTLNYHGDGISKSTLENFVRDNNIKNVKFTGRYSHDIESILYRDSDLINVMRFGLDINNITAIPNRLYSGLIYGKPFLALSGTYLSEVILEYGLGLVVDSFDNLEDKVLKYLMNFDRTQYFRNACKLLDIVFEDNINFELNFKKFIYTEVVLE